MLLASYEVILVPSFIFLGLQHPYWLLWQHTEAVEHVRRAVVDHARSSWSNQVCHLGG